MKKHPTISSMNLSDKLLRLSFRPYRRKFEMPLRVAWGVWHLREGIILKLEDQESGKTGYGEIAPLEPFGTESLEASLRHIFALKRMMTGEELETCIAEAPAASAFGLRSALQSLHSAEIEQASTSALVHLDSLDATIDVLRSHGTSVFKLKIGIQPAKEEQEQLDTVLAELKPDEKLRLDPNQAWDLAIWKSWLPWLARAKDYIQFIEEPFNPESISSEDLLKMAGESPVPVGLDESLSRGRIQPWIDAGWSGFWVIKPSLHGDSDLWLSSLRNSDKVILSSAFETGIGLSSIIRLAANFPAIAHGLGTQAFFNDNMGIQPKLSTLSTLTRVQTEEIWNNLPDD
jgi:O-succinylbenzoate synthase